MSFKNRLDNNTEMHDDRMNEIIAELMDKTKLLADELRNSNRIATELMTTNVQLKQEYTILKNKFLEFLDEDDLQDYISSKTNPQSNINNHKTKQLSEELMNLKSNKRALEIECANLKQELSLCKSRLTQSDKQARSYALLQNITANKDQEINNLQQQLQLLTTQVQQDMAKQQTNIRNTQIKLGSEKSPQDATYTYYSFQQQGNLPQVGQENNSNDNQSSKSRLFPQYSLHISPNANQNKDILDNSKVKQKIDNLDASNSEEIAGEVEIMNEKIKKTSHQQDQQPRSVSLSGNNQISYDQTKKVVHQQSHSILPTSNTTLPPSTTNRTNLSHRDHQDANVNVHASQNNTNRTQSKHISGNTSDLNNPKKPRGMLDRSESQPVLLGKIAGAATPYYQRNFLANDFNELLYSEQQQQHGEDFSEDIYDKYSSNHSNHQGNLQFSNIIEPNSFNAQLKILNPDQQNARNQTGTTQQLNYPLGHAFVGKQPPQIRKESQILVQVNENTNSKQLVDNIDRQNLNKNNPNGSQISPLNKNINNTNKFIREDENGKQQYIDPYQNQQTKYQKSNNNSLGIDQHFQNKDTKSSFLKKQQGGTRNSSVSSNKWK